jgi:hypothetical protein
MSEELAREVTRSMRDQRSRWEAPDHGWNIDLYCRRDDGLEVCQSRGGFTPEHAGKIRIQGLGGPGNHYSQSMQLEAVYLEVGWLFGAARALLREMEALHREKDARKSDAALKALRTPIST